MITQDDYIAYFTNLAAQHKVIQHGVGGKEAFFFIPMEMDLREIDNQLRAKISSPLLALDAMTGMLDDAQGASFTQTVNGQFTILSKQESGKQTSIRDVQKACYDIGVEVLARMSADSRKGELIQPLARFTIHNVLYDPVGPMGVSYYGQTFRFKITCPFSYTVNSAIWSDK